MIINILFDTLYVFFCVTVLLPVKLLTIVDAYIVKLLDFQPNRLTEQP
jgi:hypothetical protein